jgi:hypothetical protein
LRVAGNELAKSDGLGGLILITDGMETCHGDPNAEAAKLAANPKLSFGIHVVGFDVDPKERQAVEGIAKSGKGTFYDAQSPAKLNEAVERLRKGIERGARPVDADGPALANASVAEPAEVVKKDGHVSPLTVEITHADGRSRRVLLDGVRWNSFFQWQFFCVGAGKSEVTFWLDAIREISDIDATEATITLKDGTKQTFKHDQAGGGPKLIVLQEKGGKEVIELKRLKSVRFLKPVRKDSQDKAMFDHWQFSPFTGEKLPKDRFASVEPLKVAKRDGHASPLSVEITQADGKSRKIMLGGFRWNNFFAWQYYGVGAARAEVKLWLDDIQEISNISDAEATFTFKDGKKQTLKHDLAGGGPKLIVYQEGDGKEMIELKRLKGVRFLRPSRQDSEDRAMFDHWQFSPFTGEKLTGSVE